MPGALSPLHPLPPDASRQVSCALGSKRAPAGEPLIETKQVLASLGYVNGEVVITGGWGRVGREKDEIRGQI